MKNSAYPSLDYPNRVAPRTQNVPQLRYVHAVSTTAKDVAEFMVEEKAKTKWLYQEVVVRKIREKFGEDFVYTNDNGNWAIDREVLKEFKRLTPELVWDRGDKSWRDRQGYDSPGGRASD